jgi:hypothetical protein
VIRDVLDVGSEVWVATASGVARCADGVWSVVQQGELESVTQLAVDSAGAVLALGAHRGAEGTHLAVVRHDGAHWVVADAEGSPRGGSQVVANPQGGVVVRLSRSAWQYDGTAWRRFTLLGTGGRIGSLGEPALAITADGTVCMLGEEAVVHLDRHGSWQPATSDAIGACVGGWGSSDHEGHAGSATLLRPDGTTERVTLPASPEDIGWIVAGADGSLWVTV